MVQSLIAQHFRDKESWTNSNEEVDIVRGKGKQDSDDLGGMKDETSLTRSRQGLDYTPPRSARRGKDNYCRLVPSF